MRRRFLFWRALAVAMLLLGVNKQLDLQSLIPILGRRVARMQGWYEDRHAVQTAFIASAAGAGVLGLSLFLALFRSAVARNPMAPVGVAFLIVFVLIRASSFHHVDLALGHSGGVPLNAALELGGIACVAASAIRRGSVGPRAAREDS